MGSKIPSSIHARKDSGKSLPNTENDYPEVKLALISSKTGPKSWANFHERKTKLRYPP
jgi:hypothetical protein